MNKRKKIRKLCIESSNRGKLKMDENIHKRIRKAYIFDKPNYTTSVKIFLKDIH